MLSPNTQILITDDEDLIRWSLRDTLEAAGYHVFEADTGERALEIAKKKNVSLVLLDIMLPGQDGLAVLKELKAMDQKIQVIMITAFGSIENAVKCIKEGAYDYLAKPFNLDEVVLKVNRALDNAGLARELDSFKKVQNDRLQKDRVVFESLIMKQIMAKIGKINEANVDVVFLTGETGTGKGLIARQIHSTGSSSSQPFVTLNCAAIPDNLLESELFGHEKGAFTDAKQDKKGVAELAQGGTLFLDEIGEMPYRLQSKMLQFIEEKKIRRLGGYKEIELHLRLISATNRDVQKAMLAGELRPDLYHRLSLIHIHIPPLRERPEDISPLSEFFLQTFARKYGKVTEGLTDEAREKLLNYPWPGNVRELGNVLERCCILENTKMIDAYQLSQYLTKSRATVEHRMPQIDFSADAFSFENMLSDYKRYVFDSALKQSNHNKARAAKLLRMDRSTFRYQMKMLGFEISD